MTQGQILNVLLDLVGANVNTFQALGQIAATLPEEHQEAVAKAISTGMASNTLAFETLKKALNDNG